MRKTIQAFIVVVSFICFGFGITPEANSRTAIYQELPCYKKKGEPMPGAGFLYCPKFIITLSCDYKYDYLPSDEMEDRDECNFNPL